MCHGSRDTDLLMGALMDINDFTDASKGCSAGGVPATGCPVLMGITKASLETNSFLSAASFQKQLGNHLQMQLSVVRPSPLVSEGCYHR